MFSFLKKKPLISHESQAKIVQAIKEAEGRTSGELRVFVEAHCGYMDAMDRARELFNSLQMHKTKERNAVIIYVALLDKQFALFGDQAIYEKAGGPEFWHKSAAHLRNHMKKNEVMEGLCQCIHELGSALATHFPYDATTDKNELPDEIIFGK
jgi:uncharacterized membrane protein